MKTGGGLAYVEGPMGAGKSLYAVRRIAWALSTLRPVVTNVQLHPDALLRIARHSVPAGRLRPQRVRAFAQRMEDYYHYEDELQAAMLWRVPGKGEARALFVWDEGHNDLNNRSWRDDGRAAILEWGTQLRKLGFLGFLLSQHADNTDAALRRICNYRIRLQNQREATRVLGMRITPWPLFIASWYQTHAALPSAHLRAQPLRVERYFLGWHRHLYDTHGLYHGLAAEDDEAGVLWLPMPGGRPSAARRMISSDNEKAALHNAALSEDSPAISALSVQPPS